MKLQYQLGGTGYDIRQAVSVVLLLRICFRVSCPVATRKTSRANTLKWLIRLAYVDLKTKKPKRISLLTDDMEMSFEEIIAIYPQRWEIENFSSNN